LQCAEVTAWVGRDPRLFVPLFSPQALLVEQGPPPEKAGASANALYCPAVEPELDATLRSWLFVRSATR
jgi:hypothetical protein